MFFGEFRVGHGEEFLFDFKFAGNVAKAADDPAFGLLIFVGIFIFVFIVGGIDGSDPSARKTGGTRQEVS
jgi:hypothetical protein